MASLKRNMAFNTIGGLWYQGCLWLITVLVVRLSSNYEYSGMLALGMTVGNMMSALGTFNVRIFQVTDSSNKFSQSEYVAFRIASLTAATIMLLVYSLFISNSNECYLSILAFLVFKIDESFVDVLYGIDQRHERMDYIGISQLIRGVLVVALFTITMAVFDSLPAALVAMTVPCVAITFLFDWRFATKLESIKPRINLKNAKALFVACLPLVVSIFLLGMIVSIARQIYGSINGVEKLGIYAAVATPAVLIQAGARFLYSPLIVPLCGLYYDDLQKFKMRLTGISLRLIAISVIAVVALGLVGPHFLTLVFGDSIAGYSDLFPGVLACSATSALLYFVSDILVLCRFIKWNCVAAIVSFICSLLFSFPLESMFDMNGINATIILANLVGIIFAYAAFLFKLKGK